LSITLLRVVPAAQARAINDHFPVAAVDWLASTDAGSRIFNEYEWGGYLGERLPNEPIFMDGRADVYGDRLLHMYAQTIGLQIDPEAVFDQYRIDHVLFSTDAPLARWLDRDERWTLAFRDSMASIWIRKT
jgi:hypothetical protein